MSIYYFSVDSIADISLGNNMSRDLVNFFITFLTGFCNNEPELHPNTRVWPDRVSHFYSIYWINSSLLVIMVMEVLSKVRYKESNNFICVHKPLIIRTKNLLFLKIVEHNRMSSFNPNNAKKQQQKTTLLLKNRKVLQKFPFYDNNKCYSFCFMF